MPSYLKTLQSIRSWGGSEIFADFCKLSACCLSAQQREEEYLAVAKKYTREELDILSKALAQLILEMETKPYIDLLGPAYMEMMGKNSQQRSGAFHTPQEVCRMMVRMACHENLHDGDIITVCEPCSGSGAIILALGEFAQEQGKKRRLRVWAIDIDATACDMCFINTTLWYIPAVIYHGNALSMKFWSSHLNLPGQMSHWPTSKQPAEPDIPVGQLTLQFPKQRKKAS